MRLHTKLGAAEEGYIEKTGDLIFRVALHVDAAVRAQVWME